MYSKRIKYNGEIINSSEKFSKCVQEISGIEARYVVLSHLQRGGNPTSHDRYMASLFGIKAVQALKEGKSGYMIKHPGLKEEQAFIHFSKITDKPKKLDKNLIDDAKSLLG